MPSFATLARPFVLAGLLAAALVSGGCKSGFSSGEGVGIKSYADGELAGNVPGDLNAATAAVMEVLVQMGVLNATDRRDSVQVEINAKTLQEVTLQIRVSRLSDEMSRIRIRAGENDEAAARSFYNTVRARLQQQFN